MQGLTLSKAEVIELTGFKRFNEQRQWLIDNGFTFKVAKDNAIKLLRSHVEDILNPGHRERTKKTKGPDWSVFEA